MMVLVLCVPSDKRSRRNSPVQMSHNLTVLSRALVIINCEMTNKVVIRAVCPNNEYMHRPVVMSHNLAVESASPKKSMCWYNFMQKVGLSFPRSVRLQTPVLASHTRIVLSSEPDTM